MTARDMDKLAILRAWDLLCAFYASGVPYPGEGLALKRSVLAVRILTLAGMVCPAAVTRGGGR